MIIKSKKSNKAFVMIFAVTLSALVLSIAIGVLNIALKEVKFSTSARDSNDAFFAADTGIECALQHDKEAASQNAFTGTSLMNCASNYITISGSAPTWSFVVLGLGSTGSSCSIISVNKVVNGPDTFTTIISKGYNFGNSACLSSSPNRIEREIRISY